MTILIDENSFGNIWAIVVSWLGIMSAFHYGTHYAKAIGKYHGHQFNNYSFLLDIIMILSSWIVSDLPQNIFCVPLNGDGQIASLACSVVYGPFTQVRSGSAYMFNLRTLCLGASIMVILMNFGVKLALWYEGIFQGAVDRLNTDAVVEKLAEELQVWLRFQMALNVLANSAAGRGPFRIPRATNADDGEIPVQFSEDSEDSGDSDNDSNDSQSDTDSDFSFDASPENIRCEIEKVIQFHGPLLVKKFTVDEPEELVNDPDEDTYREYEWRLISSLFPEDGVDVVDQKAGAGETVRVTRDMWDMLGPLTNWGKQYFEHQQKNMALDE